MGVQALVFTLGETLYGVNIDAINEIVERQTVTPLPGSALHVRGVMDLRGETTTIVDPKLVLDTDAETNGDRVIIFESEDGQPIGWLVDEVHEVGDFNEEDIEAVSDDESVEGVVRSEDRFIIWIDPAVVNSQTEQAVPAE